MNWILLNLFLLLSLIFIIYLFLFLFFLQKNIFHHTFKSLLVESGFFGDRQQLGVDSGFTQQIVSIRGLDT